MTGIGGVITDLKKKRIEKMTEEGLPTSTISERTGINQQQIYNYQIKAGLRKKVSRGTVSKNPVHTNSPAHVNLTMVVGGDR